MVQAELLDGLPPEDAGAIRSRGDLRRINKLMRNPAILGKQLRNFAGRRAFDAITELGAGDGHFLLEVAKNISPLTPKRGVTLLDFKKNVSDLTLADFEQRGWRAREVVADVFAWPELPTQVVVANLFLHHFENDPLARLLSLVAQRAELFIAIEPRRGRWPLWGSRLLGVIGCNAVTRHDAVVSVQAGFASEELSALWPQRAGWRLTEKSAAPFSHLFVAQRILST
jgi:hypothetical protein